MAGTDEKRRPPAAGKGRPKGSLNKVTADIRALAREHGPAAIETLIEIMQGAENDASRIAAAKELLDRGFGKSVQAVEHSGQDGKPLSIKVLFGAG